MKVQLLLIAKAPVPGLVKTRLCPPCTPRQAADLAAAAIADTVEVLDGTPATRRTFVLSGQSTVPDGWRHVAQRGDGLASRLANAFSDTALPDTASLLVGMDTPQLTTGLLTAAVQALTGADAVLGLATDGGWWGLGLRDPAAAKVLRDVPMSTAQTGALTEEALWRLGLRVATLPVLRDVDTWADAQAVAGQCPRSRFASVLARQSRSGAEVSVRR